MKTRLIVNPTAGAGSAGRQLPRIQSALEQGKITCEVCRSEYPGHATELARSAIGDGVERLIVVGGDGTINEVSQAYMDEQGKPISGPQLGLIPLGTGGDFRKTFGLGTDLEGAIERLVQGSSRPLDLGVLQLQSESGRTVHKAFLNIASFGISGLVDRIVNRAPKWIGGKAAFFLGSARASLVYKNAPVEIRVDDEPWYSGPILTVAIANGQYFGGGMMIAPDADPGDGLFDIVALTDIGKLQGVSLSTQLYSGKHIGAAGVLVRRGKTLSARPLSDTRQVLIDLDGETPGHLPVRATLHAGALSICA